MVKIEKAIKDIEHVDLSIIPSLRCNLECSFCMYECGSENRERPAVFGVSGRGGI